jgi:predicted MPP superfamily phosphohydrolase
MSRFRRAAAAVGLATALTGGGLGAWGLWFEPRSLVVRAPALSLAGWRGGPAVRVAMLSDLHLGAPHMTPARLARIVQETNAQDPDLVVLLGDYVINGVVGGAPLPLDAWAPALADLDAPGGVFAVLGNHDWWNDGDAIRAALEANGVAVLEDEAVRVELPAGPLWIAGFEDQWTRTVDVGATLAQVTDDAPVLGLSHTPDLFPDLPPRVGLLLAGHTHGGQVRLPLLGTPTVPSRFGDRYVHGHVHEDGRDLYVTAGVGTSILPVRFGVPPELVVLTLDAP